MSREEFMQLFSENLRKKMKEAKMTRIKLSKKTGICIQSISNYTNMHTTPSIENLINISYALDCTIDELVDFGDTIEYKKRG